MFNEILNTSKRFTINNSPQILAGVAVGGVILTGLLSYKAAIKADQLIAEEELRVRFLEPGYKLTLKEKVNVAWPAFVPPVLAGAGTIAAILGSNHIHGNRAAAVTTALGVSERMFSEYKDKVREIHGANKEQAVVDAVAQDRINNTKQTNEIVIVDAGDVITLDSYSGRYFKSSMEELKKAQNDTNYQIIHEMYASLNDFYDRIGLDSTDAGEEVGWTQERLLEIQYTSGITPEQKPCLVITFLTLPVRKFYRQN